jgi:hypothetical protein
VPGNCSACFGWYFHPSSGAHTTVSTESGIFHTVTAICRYHGRGGTGLSVLWVADEYIGILLGAHPILHISRIKVKVISLLPFWAFILCARVSFKRKIIHSFIRN